LTNVGPIPAEGKKIMNQELKILKTATQKDYELMDSGDGEKLERFGGCILRRPDPQALWKKNLPEDKWADTDANFVRSGSKGSWKFKKDIPKEWKINFGGLKLNISPTPFKHTGLFPEQLPNWEWMVKIVESEKLKVERKEGIQILNLFGYTGGATLACAKAGASITHVDASKASISWARENAELSGLKDAPIRWMLDDALEFVKKEVRRGKKYDAVIMDPPAFGRSPDGKVWNIEEGLTSLIENCTQILSEKPLFFIINGYASGYSAIAYANNLEALKGRFGGTVEAGELTIEETNSRRLLPAGIFARWSVF
jgi:23S rRNA (cytosine1962-C5)-methyltransferase